MHGAWEAKQAQLHRLDLRPLAGLRALACLGILAAHLMYWVGAAHPDKHEVRQATAQADQLSASTVQTHSEKLTTQRSRAN